MGKVKQKKFKDKNLNKLDKKEGDSLTNGYRRSRRSSSRRSSSSRRRSSSRRGSFRRKSFWDKFWG